MMNAVTGNVQRFQFAGMGHFFQNSSVDTPDMPAGYKPSYRATFTTLARGYDRAVREVRRKGDG